MHSTYEQPEYTRNVLGRDFVPTHFTLNKLINLSYIRKVEWIRSPCLGGHGHVLNKHHGLGPEGDVIRFAPNLRLIQVKVFI